MNSRQYRVGSWSMGIAMIFMGLVLIASQLWGLAWLDHAMLWWPLLLVLLGAEVLIYLWRSQHEQPVIKYDIFSIMIVAFLGGMCLLFSVGHATGAVVEIRETIGAKMKSVDIAPLQQELSPSVKRVVLQAEQYLGGSIHIEAGESARVELFGNCRMAVNDGGRDDMAKLQISRYRQVEDTVYLAVNKPDEGGVINKGAASCYVTVVLPQSLNVDLSTGPNHVLIPTTPKTWNKVKGGY
ncbi:hypothetical protein AB6A23_01960 [Paenibacillus tarimensis]